MSWDSGLVAAKRVKPSEPAELLRQILLFLSRPQSSLSFPISTDLDEMPDNFLVASSCFILNGQTHALAEKIYERNRSLYTGKAHVVLTNLAPLWKTGIHSRNPLIYPTNIY